MKITDVKATWLRYPIPEDKQHVSDFGRLTTFDMTLVEVETDGVTLNETFVKQYQVIGSR
jgi:hypothetical protein